VLDFTLNTFLLFTFNRFFCLFSSGDCNIVQLFHVINTSEILILLLTVMHVVVD